MDEILAFLRTYRYVIFLIVGLAALWEIRKFIIAWEDVRSAAFGLERDAAQGRLNRAAILLVLILFMGLAEFTVAYFVSPVLPGANPLATPTLGLIAAPTSTIPPAGLVEVVLEEGVTPSPPPTPVGEGCLYQQLEITSPVNGETVQGKVTLIGSVDLPNVAFYTYEIARPGETIWLPIQAGRGVRKDESLGDWFTDTLLPGEYALRLVATDNAGSTLGTCEISVYVAEPTE